MNVETKCCEVCKKLRERPECENADAESRMRLCCVEYYGAVNDVSHDDVWVFCCIISVLILI